MEGDRAFKERDSASKEQDRASKEKGSCFYGTRLSF